jgi:hypothetical protein
VEQGAGFQRSSNTGFLAAHAALAGLLAWQAAYDTTHSDTHNAQGSSTSLCAGWQLAHRAALSSGAPCWRSGAPPR